MLSETVKYILKNYFWVRVFPNFFFLRLLQELLCILSGDVGHVGGLANATHEVVKDASGAGSLGGTC